MYILRTESSANKSGGYAYTRYVFEQHGGKVKGRLVVSKVMHVQRRHGVQNGRNEGITQMNKPSFSARTRVHVFHLENA